MMSKLTSSLLLALNKHFFAAEHFELTKLVNDEQTKKQPTAYFEHTF